MWHAKSAWAGGICAAVFFLVCVGMTRTQPGSWNDMSRVAAIESIVERGTWQIDDSPWAALTKDKAYLRGRFYSDKMPLLNLLGGGIYALQHWGWGATLSPDCRQSGARCAYYGLTLMLMGVPAVALIWLFFDFQLKQRTPRWTAVAATITLAFATMVWPYSLVINHHLPSAVALFASFYLLETKGNPRGWVFAGFCAALAASIDVVSVILCGGLATILLVRAPRGLIYFGAGALVPLLITGLIDYQITGTLAPPYLVQGAYAFPGSKFADTPGGVTPPMNVPQYAFDMLLGPHGLYAFAPVLFLALAGIATVAHTKGHPLRWEAICIGTSYVATTVYLATQTANLGGVAYGQRLYLHAVPLVLLFIVFTPLTSSRWWTIGIAFGVMFTVSAASACQGARHPWRYSPPLAHLTRDPDTGAIGWWWNRRAVTDTFR